MNNTNFVLRKNAIFKHQYRYEIKYEAVFDCLYETTFQPRKTNRTTQLNLAYMNSLSVSISNREYNTKCIFILQQSKTKGYNCNLGSLPWSWAKNSKRL